MHGANGSTEVHRAAQAAGEYIASLRPDVLLLSTPHGVALQNDFALYANSRADGFAAVGGDLHNASVTPYKVPLNATIMDANLTKALVPVLGENATALSSFADSEPQALRWGEVIPLTFLPAATRHTACLLYTSPSPRDS